MKRCFICGHSTSVALENRPHLQSLVLPLYVQEALVLIVRTQQLIKLSVCNDCYSQLLLKQIEELILISDHKQLLSAFKELAELEM